jgi:tetratricopeptide (TPR) repeat protein
MNERSLHEQVNDLMREERWREAIVLCESTPPSTRSFDVQWNCAWAHFKLNEFAAAKLHFEKILHEQAEHPATLLGLGVVLHRLGIFEEAKEYLKRTLVLKDSITARLTLALLFMEEGDFVSAEQVHLEGLNLKPESVERIKAYADFLSDAGREDEAAVQYSRSLKLESENHQTG